MLNLQSFDHAICFVSLDFVKSEKITGGILSVSQPQIHNEKLHYSVHRAWNLPEVTKDVTEFYRLCEMKRYWSLSFLSGVAAHIVLQGCLGGWFLVFCAIWTKSDVTCFLLPSILPVLKTHVSALILVVKWWKSATSFPLLQILTMSARAM